LPATQAIQPGPTGRENPAQGFGRRPMPWVNMAHSHAA
jgi:hypothetical protein